MYIQVEKAVLWALMYSLIITSWLIPSPHASLLNYVEANTRYNFITSINI